MQITIDGPVAAGKTTTAKAVAKALDYVYVDTGALYRAVAVHLLDHEIKLDDVTPELLENIKVRVVAYDDGQHVTLNGTDVTDRLRTPEVSKMASDCSALPAVREHLLSIQLDLACENDVVMEGRDIGTVILPDADVKFYLTADTLARAQRRFAENRSKWPAVHQDPEKVLADLITRDLNDINRVHGPLTVPPDAVTVDNTNLSKDQTVALLLGVIEEKTGVIA